jgi:hypothetical protein
MVESAALLIDEVLPAVPMRQWVLSFPFALRFLFANNPAAMGEALRIVYRTISGFLIPQSRAHADHGAMRGGHFAAALWRRAELERAPPYADTRWGCTLPTAITPCCDSNHPPCGGNSSGRH